MPLCRYWVSLILLCSQYNVSKLFHLQELTVCRNTLEIGAQYCVEKKDIPGFEKYMAQLQTYYLDYSEKEVGDTEP